MKGRLKLRGFGLTSARHISSNTKRLWKSKKAKLLLPCVTSWKPVLFAHFLNAELLRAVAPYKNEKQEGWTLNSVNMGKNCRRLCLRTHQIGEAPNRKATGSCDKLQQSHPLLIVHLLNKLTKHLCKNTNLMWAQRKICHPALLPSTITIWSKV